MQNYYDEIRASVSCLEKALGCSLSGYVDMMSKHACKYVAATFVKQCMLPLILHQTRFLNKKPKHLFTSEQKQAFVYLVNLSKEDSNAGESDQADSAATKTPASPVVREGPISLDEIPSFECVNEHFRTDCLLKLSEEEACLYDPSNYPKMMLVKPEWAKLWYSALNKAVETLRHAFVGDTEVFNRIKLFKKWKEPSDIESVQQRIRIYMKMLHLEHMKLPESLKASKFTHKGIPKITLEDMHAICKKFNNVANAGNVFLALCVVSFNLNSSVRHLCKLQLK